jgi:hypothetical protein
MGDEIVDFQTIYIVLLTDKREAISKVLYSSTDELNANNKFLNAVEERKKEDSALSCYIVNKGLAVISRKAVGWVSSSNEILSVIQLLSFDLQI